uniref:Uncharacterized protein n=1 Tax=Ombrophytum subterraneum TaxID=50155 RepID=A0A6M8PL53_9MAGN|nr:hypothetical protein [Ombrophytum subterraneum]
MPALEIQMGLAAALSVTAVPADLDERQVNHSLNVGLETQATVTGSRKARSFHNPGENGIPYKKGPFVLFFFHKPGKNPFKYGARPFSRDEKSGCLDMISYEISYNP